MNPTVEWPHFMEKNMENGKEIRYGRGILLTLLIVSVVCLVFPISSHAVRPYFITEDAVPIERGKSRLEFGFSFNRLSPGDRSYPLVVDFTQGVINNLDFGITIPFIIRSGMGSSNGLGDIKIKSKIRFLKGREANPLSLSGQMFIKFPTCDKDKDLTSECSGETDVGFLGIASKEFYPITVHLNLGYIFVGNPSSGLFRDVLRYSLAFDYLSLIDGLHFLTELAGETQRDPNQSTDPVAFQFGVLYDLLEEISLDGSFGFGLTEASPDFFVNAGMSYRF